MRSAAAQLPPAPPDFRAVYEQWFGYVWRTLQRLGVRESDLPDAAQEVFVVVHRRLPDFDPTRPIGPWLGGIAFRVAVAERRRARHRRERLTEGAVLAQRPSTGPCPEQAALAAARRRRVLAALDTLDADRRAVFVLHELEGHSCPEIAEALSVPLNTVYSRLRVARQRFKQAAVRLRRREGET